MYVSIYTVISSAAVRGLMLLRSHDRLRWSIIHRRTKRARWRHNQNQNGKWTKLSVECDRREGTHCFDHLPCVLTSFIHLLMYAGTSLRRTEHRQVSIVATELLLRILCFIAEGSWRHLATLIRSSGYESRVNTVLETKPQKPAISTALSKTI